jgi:hypothetical protein
MKNLLLALIVFSSLGSSNSVYASEIFKCIDENIRISYSFSPCSVEYRIEHDEETGPTLEEQTVQLEKLDKEISRVNRQFRDLRLEQEHNLQSAHDLESKQLIHQGYQETTRNLLDELIALKAKRGELVEESVSLLSQTSQPT